MTKNQYLSTLFSFVVLASSPSLQALIGMGNLVTHTAKYQVDKKGGRSYFSLGPYVSGSYNFQLPYRHEFVPELGLALHGKPSPYHSTSTFFMLYPLMWELVDQHWFRYGVANFVSAISGPGGKATLENGNSSTEFSRPSKTSWASNGALVLGYEYRFRKEKFGVRADLYSISPLSKNRTLGYSASFNFYYL